MAELDVIIPVYNEGENIVPVLETFVRHIRTPFRVLICYDRDDDDTLPAIARWQGAHQMDIIFVKNRRAGAHGAVRTGFDDSQARAVIVFPADDTNNASIIDGMFQLFDGGCEVVCASRFMRGGAMEGCPWLKAFLVRGCAYSLYYIGRMPTHDASNGLRLFSRRLLQSVTIESSRGFSYSLELLAKCHRLGWRIGEVPSLWVERSAGRSRFNVGGWVLAYLRWYFYALATTFLRRSPETVRSRAESLR